MYLLYLYIRSEDVHVMAIYQTLSDVELVSLLNEGDEKSYTEIYLRYHTFLLIFVNKKLHNKEESEDVVQEVFTNIWKNRESLILHTSLVSYLYTAVRNKALDIFARRKLEIGYVESLQSFLDTAVPGTDFLVRENDLKALIEKEIHLLPPKMREVFILSRNKRMSHREIADVLAISEQTVSTHIKRALRVLRIRLGVWAYLIFICLP